METAIFEIGPVLTERAAAGSGETGFSVNTRGNRIVDKCPRTALAFATLCNVLNVLKLLCVQGLF